jgi:hypothetical protein
LIGRAIIQRPDVEYGRGLRRSDTAVAPETKRKSKRVSGRTFMPMTLQQPKLHDPPENESGANDLVKRIRKLRWMGMEDEAERLQAELTRKCAAADSVIATPRDTD